MKNRSLSLLLAVVGFAVVAFPARGTAEDYVFSVSVLGGVGGSLDGEPTSGFGNRSFQLGIGVPTDLNTSVTLRVGRLDLGNRPLFEGLEKARLEYADVAGEYHFSESYYTSGLFLGLGAYRLAGDAAGGRQETTQIGAVFGANGEFGITRRLTFLIELSGHYVNFNDSARIYAMAHAGLAYHF
ncbi:MAG: hypothetical protein ABI609_07720 [Acidobacteriota bacterium]